MPPTSIAATASDPLFLAAVVTVVGFFGARYWRDRNRPAHFCAQLAVFAILTGLLLAGGGVPYRPGVVAGGEPRRLIASALEVVWWLAGAWLTAGFLRAFLVLGRRP